MVDQNLDPHRRLSELEAQNQELEARLVEAQETLRAISNGAVDALVVYDTNSERIYTLQGADYAYRVMVENMHEGTAYIREDGVILYANKHLSKMIDLPLEQVLGSCFDNHVEPEEQPKYKELVRKTYESSGSVELRLACSGGRSLPVLVSASAAEVDGRRGICIAVTDLTDQKQAAAREKEMQKHLMEQREQERLRIARNLHDGPLQDLIGLSFTIQEIISSTENSATEQSLRGLREVVLKLATDLRTVTNELRPPSAIRFGLGKAIRYQSEEFQARNPGITMHLDLAENSHSLPTDVTTALYMIYQEAINNIQRHSGASEVTVRLVLLPHTVTLEVQDNGIGFDMPKDWLLLARRGHLGIVGMQERAEAMSGKLEVQSSKNSGTTVRAMVPCENL